MEYLKLGNTELNVSKICLGCMAFGDNDPMGLHKWAINEQKATK